MAYTQDRKIDSLMIDFQLVLNNLTEHKYLGAADHVEVLFTAARLLEGTDQEYMIQALYDAAFYIESLSLGLRSAAAFLDDKRDTLLH